VFFGQTHSQAGVGAAATYSNSNFNKRRSITKNCSTSQPRAAPMTTKRLWPIGSGSNLQTSLD